MSTLMEQLFNKIGLRDVPNIIEKTSELMRLLELKSANIPLQINEYAKIVISGDIAAKVLGVACDQEQAIKISGLRKTHYINNRRMMEKLLDINKPLSIKELCNKLNLGDVWKKAEELLQLYHNVMISENIDVDINHPQYSIMAVYMACKLCKKKVSKPKLLPLSNLRPTQWQHLEQRWNKLLALHYKECANNEDEPSNVHNNNAQEAGEITINTKGSQQLPSEIEDYETWKVRVLNEAKAKLQGNEI
uniref:Origin recognition complex subunit 6 n=1 Tax=Glossina palpalis gambiensis TaxID=67801 RepID=A0A1B0BAQ1_9MUSC